MFHCIFNSFLCCVTRNIFGEGQVQTDLELELGPPPVAALGVVADGVAGPHPDPLRDRPVLLQLLGQLDLDAEGFVGRLKEEKRQI